MVLNGIPISENQCIGDSLETINNAFVGLSSLKANNLNPIDSPTIDLSYNSTTGVLSAEVIPLTLPTTTTFNMEVDISGIGTVNGTPYESTNPSEPGGLNAFYNGTRLVPMSSQDFFLKKNSLIYITDTAHWNYDGTTDTTSYIYIWQTYDFSIDGGTTWYGCDSEVWGSTFVIPNPSPSGLQNTVKVIQGTSYYGEPVLNMGGSGCGSVCLSAVAGTSIRFRPKFRFQSLSTAAPNIARLKSTGSHVITINPL